MKGAKGPKKQPRLERAGPGARIGPVVPELVPSLLGVRTGDEHADEGVAVPGQVLRAAVHDEIRPVSERVLERRRTECRVDDQDGIGRAGVHLFGVCGAR